MYNLDKPRKPSWFTESCVAMSCGPQTWSLRSLYMKFILQVQKPNVFPSIYINFNQFIGLSEFWLFWLSGEWCFSYSVLMRMKFNNIIEHCVHPCIPLLAMNEWTNNKKRLKIKTSFNMCTFSFSLSLNSVLEHKKLETCGIFIMSSEKGSGGSQVFESRPREMYPIAGLPLEDCWVPEKSPQPTALT